MNQRPVLRRCVACKKLLDREQLFRIIRDHKDGVALNQGTGRSAYLCPNEACLNEARRRKRLQKALRCQVPENIFEVMQEQLIQNIELATKAR